MFLLTSLHKDCTDDISPLGFLGSPLPMFSCPSSESIVTYACLALIVLVLYGAHCMTVALSTVLNTLQMRILLGAKAPVLLCI